MRVGQPRVARVLLGIGCAVAASRPVVSFEPPVAVQPVRTLHVLLSVAPELPDASRSALVAEATSVWTRAGVQLIWAAGADGSIPRDRMLRVLVIPRRSGVQEAPDTPVLGELLGVGRPGALAVASISRARQLVTAWGGSSMAPRSAHDGQLGLVLGRVIAHEIGHYLLGSAAHSRRGLMRARFETPDLIDRRSEAFDLDAEAAAVLKRAGPGALPHDAREEQS